MAVFNGTSGNDSFVAPTGTNTINGFGGIDTISFNFRLVDATFSWVGNQVIIDTPTTHLAVSGIEVFQFTDGTVNENDGNPLVDDLYYYSQYHDVWAAGADADSHYNNFGWNEHRNPNAFFNTDFYLSVYNLGPNTNPLTQYDQAGWRADRDPSGVFDTSKYLAANPDVAAANADPLAHFLQFGAGEGRQPFFTTLVAPNGFDYVYYLANNPDVAAAHADPLQHFLTFGWKEGRNPNAFFDTQGYLQTYTDVATAGVNPYLHYLIFGAKEGRIPSPAFDGNQYLAQNADVKGAGANPLSHYEFFGQNEGRARPDDPLVDKDAANNFVLEGAAAGTAVGLTVNWDDWHSSALHYSIIGDTSSGGFAIDTNTGVVTVADSTKIDFETSGAAHTYTVTVQAKIGNGFGSPTKSQDFVINVGDVGAGAPVDSNGAANTVAEGAANGTAVGITLSSNEPNGPPVTYSLTDTAGGRFAVDPTTGVVTVANAALIDFETSGASHQYTITGMATAGAINTPTQNFTITVTDVGPSTPTDSNGAANTVLENAANGTTVGVTASSSDPNGPAATFALTDSAGGRFAINSSSGVVTVANGSLLDFESAHSHNITVQATVGALSSSQIFTINVGDVNDNAPVFTSSATPSVAENTTAVVNLTTTDADTVGTNPPSFTVTGGADQALFTITGGNQLRFIAARDFETQAHSYAVQVTANDGANNTVQNLTVTLTDANDNAPVFTSSATPSVAENTTAVVDLTTTDADTVGTNPPTFSITGGADSGLFTITGGNHLSFIAARDFETQAHSYAVQVTANDGVNNTVQNITVTLTDLNDTAPTFTSSATPSVAENTTAVVALTTTDPDTVGTNPPTFSITGGADAGLFTITGGNQLQFIAARDFETQAHSYAVQVTANDGVNNTVQNLTVTLSDTNDNAPVFTSSATPSVAENTTAVVSLTTTDADTVGTNPPTFTITGGADQGLFTITGGNQLQFIAARDFETQAHSYAVQVTANDGVFNTVQNLTVTLTDTNDNAPVFTSSATPSVAENTTAVVDLTTTDADTVGTNPPTFSITGGADSGLFTIAGGNHLAFISARDYDTQAHSYAVQVTANDGTNNTPQNITVTLTDTNDNSPIFQSGTTGSEFENSPTSTVAYDADATDADLTPAFNTITYSLSAGGDNDFFNINSSNGQVTFKVSPDFENPQDAGGDNVYDIVVHASDGTHDTTQNVAITVNDNNDPPTLTATGNNPVYSPGVDLFSSVSASTIEAGQFIDQLVFTVSGVNDTDETMSIDGTSVALVDLTHVASTATNGMDVTVSVVGTTATVTISKAGGIAASTMASIVDGLTYTDASVPATGSRDVTITSIHDTGGNANGGNPTGTPNVTSTILFNQPPVIDAPANADTFATSINENTTAVTTIHATDPDNQPVTPVTYSIVAGFEDALKFSIDTNSGVLTFTSAPDFETPTDTATDGSNTYIVKVRASDGASFDEQTITVTVNNVNEAPTANPDTASVQEAGGVANGTAGVDITIGFNVVAGTGTGSVADTDPDAGTTLTVNAVNGTNLNVGTPIHNAQNYGTLTLNSGGDYTYTVNQTNTDVQGLRQFTDTLTDQFTYSVTDGTNTSNTTTLTITIHGQNDNPVANADSVTVAEKGGVNNATGGTDITGFTFNAISGSGTGNVADSDVDSVVLGETLRVVGVLDGNHLADPNSVTGNIGAGISDNNNYGVLTFQNTFPSGSGNYGNNTGDGSYNFVVNQANTNFLLATEHLDLVYTYKIQDAAGATSVALLNVRINGADDLAQATADTGSMTEDDSATIFPVENNDVTDPDHDAANTISLGAVTVTSAAAGTSFVNSDATVTLANSSTAVQVALGAAFQQLHAGETATVTVPYTLTGSPGQTSTVNLVVTVSGANDVPVAVDDSGSMTEDQSGQAFTVLTGPGADTLDPDHGAPNSVTPGAVTNLVAPAGENIDVSDITIGVNGSKQITVTLGADFQHMKDGETTTFDVPYTLQGDQAGDTANATLHVTVTGANDAPSALNFTFNGANSATANTSLVLDDGIAPAPTDPAGPQKTISGSLLTGATDPDGPQPLSVVAQTNAVTAGGHGHVTVTTTGEFTYLPNPGYIGTDTFNYTVTDGNSGTPGTDTKLVTINVIAPKVWYVNADAASDGDGTSDNPFNTLSHFAGAGGVDGSGDTIFLYNASAHYTGGLTLESNEKLIGQDVGLIVPDGGGGAGTVTLEAATGVNGAIIDGGVVLGIDNTISGVTLGNTGSGTALSGTSFGTLTVNNTVVNTDNNGMILSTGAFGAGASFTSFTSAGATDVSLTSVTGSVDLGTGTMSGLFAVSGGSVNTTYSGNLSQANNAAMVSVAGGHTGTMTFQTGTLTATNGTGLQFDNADGTYNFNGTNTLSNTVGGANANAGISIVNDSDGTFSFSSNSSITGQTSSGATAFNVAGASTGLAHITYAGTIGATNATDNAGTSVSITGLASGSTVTLSGSILDSSDGGGGIGISGNANTTINFSGSAKTLNTGTGDAVSMSGNGTSSVNFTNGGLDIDTTNGTGFQASGSGTYTVTGSGNTINTTGTGAALNLSSVTVGAGGITFGTTTSTGGTNNVNLSSVTGTGDINLGSGALSGATGVAFNVSGGTGNVDYNGSIAKTSDGRVIDVQNHTSGTLSFDGAVSSTSASDGIRLTGNTSATIGFTNTLTLNTSASNTTAFDANTGGTVTATGSGSVINSGTATAINVSTTNIGSGNLIFQSVSSSGGSANGIILDTTGSSGGLHVTGTGSANTGGTIATKTGADGSTSQGSGIYLNSTSNVQLNDMNLHDFQNFGIKGTSVHNFDLTNSTVNATASSTATNGTQQGSPNNEGSIFFSELTGTANITNDTVASGKTSDLEVRNNLSGSSLTLNVSGSSFTGRDDVGLTATVQEVLLVAGSAASDSPTITANFTNNTMTNNDARDLQAIANGAATMNINIGQNNVAGSGGTFNGMPAAAIDLDHNSTGNYNFNIQNATVNIGNFNGQIGAGLPIEIFNGSQSGSGSTFQGRIVQSTINGGNNPGGGFGGIDMTGSGPGTMTVLVDNNTVNNVSAVGIAYTGAQLSATNHTNLTITNNTVNMPSNGNDSFGIEVSASASSSATAVVEANISGNNVTNDTASPDYRVDARFSTATLQMPGYAGGSQDLTAIKAFVAANNKTNGATSTSSEVSASVGIAPGGNFTNTPGGAAVPLPNNPQPMLALDGGVASASASSGEMNLTQAQLSVIVAAAIEHWAAAGASADQIATLQHVSYEVGDAMSGWLAESTANHVLIDVNANGHGWFVDPTPLDSSEFANLASPTRAFTDPASDAAGHMDLLTVVMHEMGEQLGLADQFATDAQNNVMSAYLQDGERRLPGTADAALAQQQDTAAAAQAAEALLPTSAAAATGTPIAPGGAGDDTFNIDQGGTVVAGGGGADTFIFGQGVLTAPAASVTHIADYSALQGDIIDVSAIVTLPPIVRGGPAPTDADMVRVAEDTSGAFATLEVSGGGHWTAVAQLDGVHAGDAVNVALDATHTPHQLHAAWLA